MANTYKKKHKRVKKNHNVLGMVLCFLLGLVIGIVGIVGGVVGAGSYVLTQPVDKTIGLIDNYVPADLYGTLFGTEDKNGFLNEKYASLKVSDLLGDSAKAISGLSKDGSLSSLNEISPKVGELVDKLMKTTDKYAIPLDKETLMTKGVKDLPKYLGDSVKITPLGDLLQGLGKGNDPLLMAISYGEEGVDYTYDAEGNVVMLGDAKKTTVNDLMADGGMDKIIDKLTLDSVMTVNTSDTVMCAIAYGSSNRYKVGDDGKVQMTQVTYTVEKDGDVYKLYDDKDTEVVATPEALGANLLKLTLTSGEVQYVSFNADGVGVAYSDEALTSPILYKKTKIGDLTQDSMAVINNIYLKDALSVDAKQHKVLISLAYGEENVDYKYVGEGDNKTIEMIGTAKPRTIGELRGRGGDLINDIPLSDIMATNKDEPIVMYLLYGRENIHYTIDASNNVTMLQKQIALIGETAYNEYGEKLSGCAVDTANALYTDSDGNQYKYVAATGLTVETNDGIAPVYYLTDLEGAPVYFTKTKLGDMAGSNNVITSLTKRITIKEVMDAETVNSNKFFKHVKDETIETLPDAINDLTLQKVYDTEIFKTDANGNFLDKNGNITTNKDEYVVEHEWWYLLHDAKYCEDNHTSCDKECLQDYNITEMDTLITNMRNNIEQATLNQLKEDGMIDGLDDATLASNVKTSILGNDLDADKIPTGKTKLGEFTVVEMLSYVNAIFKVVEKIEGATP